MTEEQWLACTDPTAMLEFLRGNPTGEDAVAWHNSSWRFDKAATGQDRKFRLLACACCRRIWNQIPEVVNRDAVAAVEDFLEGRLEGPGVQAALAASSTVEWKEDGSGRRTESGYWAVKYLGRGFYKLTAGASALLVSSLVICMADEEYGRAAWDEFNTCFYSAAGVFLRPLEWPSPRPAPVEAELSAHVALLRCVFGNPFRPASVEPAVLHWQDGLIPKLALAGYEERAFDRLPILADALEDAGSADSELLNHLRSPGPHVRGCFALDLLLGKQ